MNISLILIIVLIILIIYKLSKKSRLDGDTDIYQINNFDKNIYHKYLLHKKPIVIKDYLINFPSFELICMDVLKDMDSDCNIRAKIKNKLLFKNEYSINLNEFINNINNSNYIVYNNYEYFRQYTYDNLIVNYKSLTNGSSPNYSLNIFGSNFKTPITKNLTDNLLFLIYDGELNITLYNPFNNNNRKLDNEKAITIDKSRLLLSSNIEDIEGINIICRPGKILSIPINWYFTIESISASVFVKLY